jgi:cytochrome c biogenesis protein CcmG/thiol:disulfide interchange protein DsbE
VLLALVLLGALAILYPQLHGVSTALRTTRDRKTAPDFELTDAGGAQIRLADYQGKVVLLNFWATWCGPCNIEIPWFNEFEAAYKDRGLSVVGVSMDEGGWKTVKPYIEQKHLSYRIVIGDDALAQKYGGVDSLPTTFLIDRDGKIAASHRGWLTRPLMKKRSRSCWLISGKSQENEDEIHAATRSIRGIARLGGSCGRGSRSCRPQELRTRSFPHSELRG